MKNKADGEQSESAADGPGKTRGLLIIHQYPILVLTPCQRGKQNETDQNEAEEKKKKADSLRPRSSTYIPSDDQRREKVFSV